jgi:hypothetical protein
MVRARRRPLALLAACLGLAAVTGCTANASNPPARARPAAAGAGPSVSISVSMEKRPAGGRAPSPPAEGVNVPAFRALAREEVGAWASSPLAKVYRAGLVLLDPVLTSPPSGGFPSTADQTAFADGALVFAGSPPTALPTGVVTWSGGATMKVPVLSAARAFAVLTRGGTCTSCGPAPLTVTAASPTTVAVPTSRGTASVPAWAFTIRGVPDPVIRVALAPGSYVTPDQASGALPPRELAALGTGFVGVWNARTSPGEVNLVADLPGSLCDTSWGGLAYETSSVVVVGGWVYRASARHGCMASLVQRRALVPLGAPVGNRVVLDAATGQPVTQEP